MTVGELIESLKGFDETLGVVGAVGDSKAGKVFGVGGFMVVEDLYLDQEMYEIERSKPGMFLPEYRPEVVKLAIKERK